MFEIECLTKNNENIIYRTDCDPFGGGCWPDLVGRDECAPDCSPSNPPMCTPDDPDCYPGEVDF